MNSVSKGSIPQKAKRIGILLADDMDKLNIPALKFLVLYMNTLQRIFEFEFLPIKDGHDFIQRLSRKMPVDREDVRKAVQPFLNGYQVYLQTELKAYSIEQIEVPTDHLILVTMARFNSGYYSLREKSLTILALGNWKRVMAPPSIIEFILTLIVRQSVALVSPSLKGSAHLGTKGCICDFNKHLSEVRFKVLIGFICNDCRSALQTDGFATLADELELILKKDWLGSSADPHTPAGIAAKLRYDLFITKGLKLRWWERFWNFLQQEGGKQIIAIVGYVIQTVVLTIVLILLGLKR